MKLGRKSIYGIIIVGFISILIVSLIFYYVHNKKTDPYDAELLKINLHDETQTAKDYADAKLPENSIVITDAAPEDNSSKSVTVCNSYSENLVEAGSKNILILGEDIGNKLYDTIGIVSIDNKSKKVSIIMLPRDMYVDYSKSVCDAIQASGNTNTAGIYKLNAAHYIGAMIGYEGKFNVNSVSFLAQVIKEKFRIDVDEYVKINTEGFDHVVDLFGGVDINVPYDMNYDDPIQDLSIHISKGNHHIDGKQAEGFVRFRQGYSDDGTKFDIDRKKNQLAFLNAFINQHGTIANVDKIPELLKTLDRNVKHSLDFRDMLLTYTGMAKDIINGKYVIENKNIAGEEMIINGASYDIVK